MASIWAQTIDIDQEKAKYLIESQFGLKIFSIEFLGEGWDNIAYLINKELVFRFPRREMGIEFMKNEISIMPYIATKISFPTSYPQYIGKASSDYPSAFAGYKILKGMSLSDIEPHLIEDLKFAKKLAAWLKELHSITVGERHKLDSQDNKNYRYDLDHIIEKTRFRILEYSNYFIEAGFCKNTLLNLLDNFKNLQFDNIIRDSYVHDDLYSRHLIVDESMNLNGIIDWGDVHVGNKGVDLAIGYMIFADEALKDFFDFYGIINKTTTHIALLRAFSHSIALLPYCYEKNEESLKGWTILALHNSIKFILREI